MTAPVLLVGTFGFADLGSALTWGALFFGERPAGPALLGIGQIVVADLLAVRRPGARA
ncbi:MAG: hypothetical protein AAFP13_08420 [Pseudomonadota bacterium]